MNIPSNRPSRLFSLLLIAVAGAALILLLFVPRGVQNRGPAHPAVGSKVEQLALQPLTGDGDPLSADHLRGKVTLLNYWGPWCPPCQIEFPHLVELHEHFRANPDFLFISVSCSGGPGDDASMEPSTAAFLVAQKASFLTYRDAFQHSREHLSRVAELGGFAYPTTVVLDRQGVIRGLWVGYQSGDEVAMQQVIEEVLRNRR